MSTANGFEQAVYNADYLNLQEPTGYVDSTWRGKASWNVFYTVSDDRKKAKLGLGSFLSSKQQHMN